MLTDDINMLTPMGPSTCLHIPDFSVFLIGDPWLTSQHIHQEFMYVLTQGQYCF